MSERKPPSLWAKARMHLQVRALRLVGRIVTICMPASPRFPPSREIFIPSTDGRRRLKLQLYDPPNPTAGPQPVYINFHGSGFIVDSLGSDGRLLTYLAREVGCLVVDADYPKAPEHPFPAAYHDAHQVVSWVLENKEGQFDVNRVAVGGVSAGGNIAMAVAGSMPPQTIKGIVVIVPAVDFTLSYAERRAPPEMPEAHRKEKDRGTPIPPDVGELMRSAYLGSYTNLKDPRLSPNYADPAKFPGGRTVFIASAEYDYLDEEAQKFRDLLAEAGREPVYLHAGGMGHSYVMTNEVGTAAASMRDETFRKGAETLRRAFA